MKNKVYILCGAPGSGKSTLGKQMEAEYPGIVRLCPDDFRAIHGKSENDQSVSAKAFDATRNGLRDALHNGKDVIIDATNMYCKTRNQFLKIAEEFDAECIAIVFEVDRETLIQRNSNRGALGGRNVPAHVIDSMLQKYQRPGRPEFDKIIFIRSEP